MLFCCSLLYSHALFSCDRCLADFVTCTLMKTVRLPPETEISNMALCFGSHHSTLMFKSKFCSKTNFLHQKKNKTVAITRDGREILFESH